MFEELETINARPRPFEFYTADELWTNEHTSAQMLAYHLNPDVDLSSRKHAFIERSARWIAQRFDLGPGRAVADFGCGPGLYTTRLVRSGARVTGVDFSPRSIAHARKTAEEAGLPIRYVLSNYLDFETEQRFDLITLIMCDLCALSPQQRATLLGRFHRFLKPGGAVLLDAYTLDTFARQEEGASYEKDQLDGFWSAAPYYGFVNVFKYEEEKILLHKYTLVEEDRTRVVYNWLQCFSPESLEAELRRAGFRVEETLGSVAGDSYDPDGRELAVVARKVG